MKHFIFLFVFCVGLTDTQYRIQVFQIVAQRLIPQEIEETIDYKKRMLRKDIKYRNQNMVTVGDNVDLATRCFAEDLYIDITGLRPTQHDMRHFIEETFQGEAFN